MVKCLDRLVPAFLMLCLLSGCGSNSSSAPAALTAASLTASNFDFGGNLVGSTLSRSVTSVINTGSFPLRLNPTISGDPSYTVVPAQSCPSTLAAGATCTMTVSYSPTAASGQTPQTATLNLGLGNVSSNTPQTVALTGTSAAVSAGSVTATNNPQVALYSMTLPYPGSMTVSFGLDTTYGRKTWSQTTTVAGGQINMLVAGMLANTMYHMQASVQFDNGLAVTDADHTFTTRSLTVAPQISVTATPGTTPQSGVEKMNFNSGTPFRGIAVTDLQGNTLWTYAAPVPIQEAKLLPNGDFLVCIGDGSSQPLRGPSPSGAVAIREIDLAGNLIREITPTDLNTKLAAAGYNFTLQQFHHDITPLPNGHWLVLANTIKPYTDLPGFPGTTNVLGDVIVDLDQNLQPVWVWNEFDHFDINRHPMGFPDWTHSNAVVYSKDDGNILVSIRHQNWVVKVDYENGTGSGNVLWRLGQGGDFTLTGGTDPTDWQYAQHMPSFFSPNTTGIFSLGLMDNGDDRPFPQTVVCGSLGGPPCLYTTIPVFKINESAKSASLVFHQTLPVELYSSWGGNAEPLANGNIEYDLAGIGSGSDIFEVSPTSTPQTVWHLHSPSANIYRGYRIPSLYPGVQW
jgi:arylsulfate sulfotransferase